jgi:hypothetical protein
MVTQKKLIADGFEGVLERYLSLKNYTKMPKLTSCSPMNRHG